MIYDRASKKLIEDKDYGRKQVHFLYTNPLGRLLLKIVSSKTFSKLNAAYNNTRISARKIPKFQQVYHLDQNELVKKDFKSFNDFFIRRLSPDARPLSKKVTDFISPADAKLSYYHISSNLVINVKGGQYPMADIIGDQEVAQKYMNGVCIILRLTLDDCHRYIFPDDGSVKWSKTIDGKLHTVRPIVHQYYKTYISNYRAVSELATEHFGDIIFIEVGALLCGKIVNHSKKSFEKGDEKGYFELGGSTIIVLLKPKTVKINEDIVDYSKRDIEVKVRQGETIGGRDV